MNSKIDFLAKENNDLKEQLEQLQAFFATNKSLIDAIFSNPQTKINKIVQALNEQLSLLRKQNCRLRSTIERQDSQLLLLKQLSDMAQMNLKNTVAQFRGRLMQLQSKLMIKCKQLQDVKVNRKIIQQPNKVVLQPNEIVLHFNNINQALLEQLSVNQNQLIIEKKKNLQLAKLLLSYQKDQQNFILSNYFTSKQDQENQHQEQPFEEDNQSFSMQLDLSKAKEIQKKIVKKINEENKRDMTQKIQKLEKELQQVRERIASQIIKNNLLTKENFGLRTFVQDFEERYNKILHSYQARKKHQFGREKDLDINILTTNTSRWQLAEAAKDVMLCDSKLREQEQGFIRFKKQAFYKQC